MKDKSPITADDFAPGVLDSEFRLNMVVRERLIQDLVRPFSILVPGVAVSLRGIESALDDAKGES